ncbi:hypothetical protein [Streptomyces phaeochromogenes]|uniref:hypothetical protein n=1 Tax=Streptomyces phaeochromogenes TaxID=1923 RepID=UPI0006E20F23|nr:hypothetical protein [Streptomyces phaeochromogenes]
MTANAYSFLPWLRAGIATRITTDPGTAERASVPVTLRVTGDALTRGTLVQDVLREVQLYGPGDVVGVDPRAISRTEPRPGVTNVEPNYLAHIEFSDEDFLWRYSPAASGSGTKRLAPWLALIVLAAADPGGGEAEFGEAPGGGPLPAITVTDPARTLPPPDQLGAWAHVHVNGSLDDPVASDSTVAALAALGEVLRTNADNACSRLICPRRLRPDTAYEAFLVPAFETGRLAGLGLDPGLSPGALYSSWGPPYPNRPSGGQLPYYHRWSFSTGTTGDFEFLVRLLQPQRPDPRVGRRDLDVHRSPGLGLPGIETPPELNGVLPLGGALKVPELPGAPVDPAENWDNFLDVPPPAPPYPHPFEQALADLVNLADDYQDRTPAQAHAAVALVGPAAVLADATATAAAPGPDREKPAADCGADPIITPPLYGRWHALTSRLLTERDGTPIPAPANHNWVHRLNLDPRFRVAANLGAQVVRAREEELMAAAWAQIGDVLVANGRIRAAQLAREVGHVLQTRHLDPPQGGSPAALAAAPVAASGRSLTLTAPTHSRLTTTTADEPDTLAAGLSVDLASKVAVGFRVATSQVAATPVSPAMRRSTRPGARLMRSLRFPEDRPPAALLARMDAATDPVTAAVAKGTPGALVTPARLRAVLHPGGGSGADPVEGLPRSPDFVLRALDDPVAPHPGATDSAEATRFKTALRELHQGLDTGTAVGQAGLRRRLGVVSATTAVLAGLRADATVPKTLLGSVSLPERLRPFAADFTEAMAYPVFDLPTYQPLLDLSVDALVPNLNLLPANSITLLANNREFIESYLVGLNHEMARELLWREYPTDQRGTPFRQFWDPAATLPTPGETPEQQRERGYDVPPIHRWSPDTRLGDNDNRRPGGAPQNGPRPDDLVLVVRGELLKKYPTAAIYAHKAQWPPGPDGQPDPTQQRELVELPPDGPPSPEQVLLPLYEAKVEPDIYLLGFDLDAARALGHAPDDAGWFFVLKERPGDPRFGVDDGPPTHVEVWNDLTWDDVDPHRRGFLELDPDITVALADFDGSEDDPEKQEQRAEDENLPLWFAGLGSADLAYILFQVPVLVAVHAQEMLPR